jgi:hypothetical protein
VRPIQRQNKGFSRVKYGRRRSRKKNERKELGLRREQPRHAGGGGSTATLIVADLQ